MDIHGNEVLRHPVYVESAYINYGLEGIALDYHNNLVYIVSDSEAKLFVFQLDLNK